MSSELVLNAALILLFICVGGVFAGAEMALVSLRDSQVKQLAHRGSRGRTVARLNENPNRFLSAVQIGVTLAGFLSAAFGGATLAAALSPALQGWFPGLPTTVADTIALVIITAIISYVSIVLGELTAKRLALQRSEAFALALAPTGRLHRQARPPGDLAARGVHRRGRADPRRRPQRRPGAGHRRGDPGPGQRLLDAR